MNKIIYAAQLAAEVHKGQMRKWTGQPYLVHPQRVAGAVSSLSDIFKPSEEMIAAAWLHDAFEETKDPSKLEARIVDEGVLGLDVIRLMWELTSASKRTIGWTKEDGKSRAERKAFDRQSLRDASREAKIIKLVDRIDNLRDIPSFDTKGIEPDYRFMLIYAQESLSLLGVLEGVHRELEEELRAASENLIWRVLRRAQVDVRS